MAAGRKKNCKKQSWHSVIEWLAGLRFDLVLCNKLNYKEERCQYHQDKLETKKNITKLIVSTAEGIRFDSQLMRRIHLQRIYCCWVPSYKTWVRERLFHRRVSYAKLTLKHQNWSIHFPHILLLIKPKKTIWNSTD